MNVQKPCGSRAFLVKKTSFSRLSFVAFIFTIFNGVGVLNHIDGKGFWTEDVDGDSNELVVDGPISGQRTVITNVTSNLTLDASTRSSTVILVNAQSNRVTVTLPDISGIEGFQISIKKIDASVNEVVIRGRTLQLIDGDASKTITQPYTSVTLVSSNNDWWIL